MKIASIEPLLRKNLLDLAEAYAKAKGGWSLRTVGKHMHGDGRFFVKLQEASRVGTRGASFTVRKYDEVLAKFAEHFAADDLPMPAVQETCHIPQPKRKRAK